eukprot:7350047-Karenia_brevis.AAC.1
MIGDAPNHWLYCGILAEHESLASMMLHVSGVAEPHPLMVHVFVGLDPILQGYVGVHPSDFRVVD